MNLELLHHFFPISTNTKHVLRCPLNAIPSLIVAFTNQPSLYSVVLLKVDLCQVDPIGAQFLDLSTITDIMDSMLKDVPVPTSVAQKRKAVIHSKADRRFFSIGVLGAILFFLAERTDSHTLAFIFKPIPIYCLIGWVQWNAHSPSIHRRLVQIGLFFGSLGMDPPPPPHFY
jgi:hypothetical protein